MTLELAAGLALALMAAVLQGTFLLPMASTRNWSWEHNWAVFSLFAMLLFNWAIAITLLPNLIPVYRSVPVTELLMVMMFGAAWGVGAVLFGLAVDKLGLALGYPIITGQNATFGAVIPMVFLVQRDASAAKVITLVTGTAIALGGIVACSVAGSQKEYQQRAQPARRTAFTAGLTIALASGILSGLPNMGMAYAVNIVKAAKSAGAPEALAGKAVWALFFTLGVIVNVGYCAWLMVRRRNLPEFFGPDGTRNLALGSLTALYADSNSFYTVPEAIRVGKLLEEYKYEYFEEPVMFDHIEEIKRVADALTIPIANGEQDNSFCGFRWLIANSGIEIVQPDNYYFGGLIQSMKVARMAAAFGKSIVPHMSGGGLGFLYNIQFVSAVPNAGAHHEFKSFKTHVRFEYKTSPLKVVDGKIKVPTGRGFGVDIDPEWVRKHQIVTL